MSYDPEITPPWGTHRYEVPHADPEPAHGARPHTAPRVERGQIDVPDDLWHTLMMARALFDAARHPRGDAMYAHLKPNLITLAGLLWRAMQDQPSHVALADAYAEVIHYLPGVHGRPTA